MLYAALTFWLLVIVFSAYGVFKLWSGLVRPKVINTVLLPGTLVAQLGHVVGLLVTGGTINNTTLIKDDDTGEPGTSSDPQTQVPVVGPIIIALLPIVACGFSIYVVIHLLGAPVMDVFRTSSASAALPTSVASFWELLRNSITLIEQVAGAIWASNFNRWQSWLFLYLIICLTVRMAPLPGTQRGAIGAILLLGLVAGLIGAMTQVADQTIQQLWDTLSFSVAILLLVMILTLMIRGTVGLFRILTNQS